VSDWIADGHPLCVRRADPKEPPSREVIALGLARPGRQRMAVAADRAAVVRNESPPRVESIVSMAPPAWRDVLESLALGECHAGVDMCVFGSLAWQAMTGLRYLHPDSDIDVLATVHDERALDDVVDLLCEQAERAPTRLDGEIVFPGDHAVAWREWAKGADAVLVKHVAGVALRPRAWLLERFACEVHAT